MYCIHVVQGLSTTLTLPALSVLQEAKLKKYKRLVLYKEKLYKILNKRCNSNRIEKED